MKHLPKQQVSYSRTAKLIIYSLGILAVAFLLYVQFYQENMYNETLAKGNKIKTSIIKVNCSNSTRSKSRLYFRNSQNEVEHVNVSYSECMEYKRGDTILVYTNEADDWYEIDPATLKGNTSKD